MNSKTSHEIISSLLSLYYNEILSWEEYTSLVEKVMPHPNFGYFCGDEMQERIDDLFNTKSVEEGFLDFAHSKTQFEFYGK